MVKASGVGRRSSVTPSFKFKGRRERFEVHLGRTEAEAIDWEVLELDRVVVRVGEQQQREEDGHSDRLDQEEQLELELRVELARHKGAEGHVAEVGVVLGIGLVVGVKLGVLDVQLEDDPRAAAGDRDVALGLAVV